MRKRRVCLASLSAKRTALAWLLAGIALPSSAQTPAAEKAPVLHVAAQHPELALVGDDTTEPKRQPVEDVSPQATGRQTAAMQLTSANDGWVAREAIGKQVPLRDPVKASLPETAEPPDTTEPPAAAEPPDTAVPPAQQRPSRPEPEPARGGSTKDDAAATPAEVVVPPQPKAGKAKVAADPLSLEMLTPVPLMAPETPTSLNGPETKPSLNGPETPDASGPSAGRSEQAQATAPSEQRPDIRVKRERTEQSIDALDRSEPAPKTESEASSMQHDQRQAALPVRRPVIPSKDAPPREERQATAPRRPAKVDTSDVDTAETSEFEETQPTQQVAPVLSASVARLQRPIEQCLMYYYQRPEHAAERSSWGLMHSIMVYGVDTQVIGGRKRYNAIAWLAGNNICRGKRLLATDRYGIAPRQGVGLQGHQAQLLAVLGLVGVPSDYPLYVDRREFTVDDLIAHEQRECRAGAELTFTLIALAHYIDTDSQWRSKDGELWDFERLIREELAQSVIGSACGGTHRLMGLSHALRIRKEEGRPITGQWARAETFIRDFTEYAWTLQNRDGSMSTNWFEGRGDEPNLDRKIQTTGHMVEWLLAHTPDDQLQEERLVRSVRFLTAAMSNNPAREKEIGPKGHALRSLAIYHQRVFGAPPPWDTDEGSRGHHSTAHRR